MLSKIKNYLYKSKLYRLIIYLLLIDIKLNSFTIMLDPAGDAKNTGRSLPNSFERGAALQFAQTLKQQLDFQYPHVHIILTKTAGEQCEALQVANFANNLQVDLFLSINFYEETSIKPNIFIYYYQNQNFFSTSQKLQLDFYPYHQAFMFNYEKTKLYAKHMQKSLSQTIYKHYFTCQPALGIPFQPLVGIISPAIGIEIGLKKNSWDPYLEPIVNSLNEILCH